MINWEKSFANAELFLQTNENIQNPSLELIWRTAVTGECAVYQELRYHGVEQVEEPNLHCVITVCYRGRLIFLFFSYGFLVECRLDNFYGDVFRTLEMALEAIDLEIVAIAEWERERQKEAPSPF